MSPSEKSPLVGREPELDRLQAAVERAIAGTGSVTLLTGEPGIGKSALVRELSRRVEARGVRDAWGRCWETGGAPVYWPFIQVARALVTGRDAGELRDDLGPLGADVAQLVPELRHEVPDLGELPPLAAGEARFRLFDAFTTFLGRSARRQPLLVLLDDLHAADPASLDLLEFIARTAEGMPVALVGTYREADARVAGLDDRFAKLRRAGQLVALGPLSEAETADLLERLSGETASAERVAHALRLSEGNPLYLEELARRPALGSGELPDSLVALIREHLETLPGATRELLKDASVLGRELPVTLLCRALELEDDAARELFDPALEAGVLAPAGAQTLRFSHVLTREALYRALTPRRRFELHGRVADVLIESAGGDASNLAEVAHHLCEASVERVRHAIEYSGRAAQSAAAVFGFQQAVRHYERALELQGEHLRDDRPLRCELLLSLGSVRILGGDSETGTGTCFEAAELARALRSPTLLARAALEAGSAFNLGRVDDRLCELLVEALDALPEREGGLRALVSARLAAARQPALDPRGPIALAHRALALAREVGDAPTLLGTLRSAISAMMDLEDPKIRAPLNREYVELAKRLGLTAEVLRGHARLAFDLVESGDVYAAEAVVEAHREAAAAARYPFYDWQSLSLRAMLAIFRGRFDEGQELHTAAVALARSMGDPTVERYSLWQAMGLSRARYDDETLDAIMQRGNPVAGVPPELGRLLVGSIQAHLEREEAVHALFDGVEVPDLSTSLDIHVVTTVAEVAYALRDRSLADNAYAALSELRDRNTSWGLMGMICDAPATRALGLAAAIRGDIEEAGRHLADAAARARTMGAQPSEARAWYDWGRVLWELAGDRARAAEPLGRARELAARLGMVGLQRRIDARLPDASAAKPAVPAAVTPQTGSVAPPVLRGDGDDWVLEHAGSTLRLRDSKGLRILARLLDEPGREYHVMDLMDAGPGVDAGHAGEHLDERARAEYRARARELRDELDEAREWNDEGRITRAQAELEAIGEELSRAVGLSGRARVAGSATERARTNVQKRIRHALKQVERQDTALARYLRQAVRTGTFCCFEPR